LKTPIEISRILDVEQANKIFKKHKLILIENIFEDEVYDSIQKRYSEFPDDWWTWCCYPSMTGRDGWVEGSYPQYNYSVASLSRGHFSYSFKRTIGDHVEGCDCVDCDMRKFVLSEDTLMWIEKITGIKLTGAQDTFSSKYEQGDFLSSHSDDPDKEDRKIAFVFNLTGQRDEKWSSDWGGLFMMTRENEPIKVIPPQPNSLVMFDVEDNISPHLVTMVSRLNNGLTRLAFSGWWNR